MSDAFDDFQIKPLTDGLGFHKKAIRLGESVARSGVSKDALKKQIPSAPPDGFFDTEEPSTPAPKKAREALDRLVASLNLGDEKMDKAAAEAPDFSAEQDVEITSTLPRYPSKDIFSLNFDVDPHPISTPSAPHARKAPSRPVVTGTLPIPPSVKVTQTVQTGTRRNAHDSKRGLLTPCAISLPSIVLDFIMVIALSLVFLVSLLSVTKVELLSVAFNAQSDSATQISLAILFVAIMQMYVVVSRSFFGRTLGEWTFDSQLGDDQQHKSGLYPLLVAWRSLLVVISGVVTLPLLSLITGKDITARLSGLQLYRRH